MRLHLPGFDAPKKETANDSVGDHQANGFVPSWMDELLAEPKSIRKWVSNMLRQNIEKLLSIHSRRLQILQEQEASYGRLATPPHILIDIEEIEADIEQLQVKLKQSETETPIPENATGILPIQVHGFSGEWEVKTYFSRWRDYELEGNNTVSFDGRAFLLLSVDGKKGSGTQTGKLYVSIDDYKETFEIANWIYRATITENGTLHMDVVVLSRTRIEEEGKPREARFREELFGSGKFQLDLDPVPDEPKRLRGIHTYAPGNRVVQKAEEDYKYLGF
jgi:hypothetical protein